MVNMDPIQVLGVTIADLFVLLARVHLVFGSNLISHAYFMVRLPQVLDLDRTFLRIRPVLVPRWEAVRPGRVLRVLRVRAIPATRIFWCPLGRRPPATKPVLKPCRLRVARRAPAAFLPAWRPRDPEARWAATPPWDSLKIKEEILRYLPDLDVYLCACTSLTGFSSDQLHVLFISPCVIIYLESSQWWNLHGTATDHAAASNGCPRKAHQPSAPESTGTNANCFVKTVAGCLFVCFLVCLFLFRNL